MFGFDGTEKTKMEKFKRFMGFGAAPIPTVEDEARRIVAEGRYTMAKFTPTETSGLG